MKRVIVKSNAPAKMYPWAPGAPFRMPLKDSMRMHEFVPPGIPTCGPFPLALPPLAWWCWAMIDSYAEVK